MKILVINGPNINMIGLREPEIYGDENYEKLTELCLQTASENEVELEIFQSNSEGAIVDKIQASYKKIDAIVINPAAYTHTSIAILDALKAVCIPCAEVHISDPTLRESFRHISYAGLACEICFKGLGLEGYRRAINYMAKKYK